MIFEAVQAVDPAMRHEVEHEEAVPADPVFERIFIAHYERVVTLLMRLVGQRTQAEELSNEAFCRLYYQPATAPVWENPAGWLYRTATNLGIDAIRLAARRRRYEKAASLHLQASAAFEPGPLDSVLRDEQRRQVRTVLSSMKPAQAQILLLRAGGCSYRELAEALGVAAGGVGTLLNRAEGEFRKRYTKLTGRKKDL
ncbi:MAG: sigma-70 family RNA polymerase sigma factor [Bryobacteraceae bacterium]